MELSHPAFLTMVDCYIIKPWAKKKKSLFSQITSAMHFIIVMKKVMLRVMLSTMGLYENVQNGIVAVTV